jgi:hypothetical protein
MKDKKVKKPAPKPPTIGSKSGMAEKARKAILDRKKLLDEI